MASLKRACSPGSKPDEIATQTVLFVLFKFLPHIKKRKKMKQAIDVLALSNYLLEPIHVGTGVCAWSARILNFQDLMPNCVFKFFFELLQKLLLSYLFDSTLLIPPK